LEAITLTLNGRAISAAAGQTILEVARRHGLDIPTLCHHDLLRPIGACRLCQVEDMRRGVVVPSCVTVIQPEMVIETHSERVVRNRRNIIRLLLAAHPESCLVCDKGNLCQLRRLAAKMGVGRPDLDRMPYLREVEDLNPILSRDLSKCILCGKCIRADQEVVVEGVLDYNLRGFEAHPATLFLGSLEHSECTFCGTCLSVCPTGAIREKGRPSLSHAGSAGGSVCSFCACGCAIQVEHQGGLFRGVSPAQLPGSANGLGLCVKGHFGHDYLVSPERLSTPLARTGEGFEALGWEAALDLTAERMIRLMEAHGPEALGFFVGSRATLEEAFLLAVLAKEVVGSPFLAGGPGLGGPPPGRCRIRDLEEAEVILAAGIDPTRSAPVLGYALKRAVRFHQARLILLDPLESKLSPLAHLRLQPRPGGEVAALAGLVKAMLDEGLVNEEFLRRKIEGRERISRSLASLTVGDCADWSGLEVEDLRRAARLWASSAKGVIVYGQGPPGQAETLTVLALLSGMLEKPGGGLLAVPTHCNAVGVGQVLEGFNGRGRAGWEEMLSAAAQGRLKGLYILSSNPLGRTAQPAAALAALNKLELLVVQDMFRSETAEAADLLLPATALAEKEGTVTSLEGRVQRFDQVLQPPGDFPAEWRVLNELAGRLGAEWGFSSPGEVFAALQARLPAYAALDSRRLAGPGALLDPVPVGDGWTIPEVRPGGPTGPGREEGFTWWLVTGPLLEHLGTGLRTGHSRRLAGLAPEGCFGLNPGDLEELGLAEGEEVLVSSAQGRLEGKVKADPRLPRGAVFAPTCFPGWRPGELVEAGATEWACPVRVEKTERKRD